MRISDWSSDVCSSDLGSGPALAGAPTEAAAPESASAGIAIARSAPRGPRSNIQPMITAIGNPRTTRAITKVTVQAGRFRPGSIVDATTITNPPATGAPDTINPTPRPAPSATATEGSGAGHDSG